MRIKSLAAVTLAAFFIAGCSKSVEDSSAPSVEAEAPAQVTEEVSAPKADSTPANGVEQEQATPAGREEPVVQELVNGQLPGYNPNLEVKDVKWSDPERKAAWEARKAELKQLRAEGKLPSQQGQ